MLTCAAMMTNGYAVEFMERKAAMWQYEEWAVSLAIFRNGLTYLALSDRTVHVGIIPSLSNGHSARIATSGETGD